MLAGRALPVEAQGTVIASNPVQQMRMKPPVEAVADEALRVHSNPLV